MKNTMTNNIQKVKDDLITELDKRVADKIIEKTNADLLKKLINQAETINEAIMIAELGTTYKRTGFHFDKRLEKMTDTIKYFKKNEKLSFVQDPKALTHKLIIGDNYDALLNLLIEYRGKIDVIYIDPPYGKDAMGEFAQTNYENAITRDNLLSMLYPRVWLAKQLLSDTGIILCSIDDRNQAYLKGIFDEIFGEINFLNNFIWINNLKGRQILGGGAVKTYESVLLYAKNTIASTNFIGKIDELKRDMPLLYKNKIYDVFTDEYGEFVVKNELFNTNSAFNEETRKNLVFNIHYNKITSEIKVTDIDDPTTFKDFIVIPPHKNSDGKHKYHAWRWSRDKILKESYNLYFDGNKVYTKVRSLGSTNIKDIITDSTNGNNELTEILGNGLFSYPKPVKLIKFLINLATYSITEEDVETVINNNAIVLDFFAGSGTTGQAVLELNKQDGGKRQFILVNANEITDTTPNGIVYDVTSKRLKRVMTGECYDGTKDFKWREKNEPLGDNLDVYDIATVANFEAAEGKTPFDVIDETLYGQEKMQVKEKIQWVCENFEGTQKKLE
jgi:adenine-specific DNA-methyltransferase